MMKPEKGTCSLVLRLGLRLLVSLCLRTVNFTSVSQFFFFSRTGGTGWLEWPWVLAFPWWKVRADWGCAFPLPRSVRFWQSSGRSGSGWLVSPEDRPSPGGKNAPLSHNVAAFHLSLLATGGDFSLTFTMRIWSSSGGKSLITVPHPPPHDCSLCSF